jgi:hypothetical protein
VLATNKRSSLFSQIVKEKEKMVFKTDTINPPMGLDCFRLLESGICDNGDFIGSKTEFGDWSLATAAATDEGSVGNLWNGFGMPGRRRLFGRNEGTPGEKIFKTFFFFVSHIRAK